MTRLFAVSVLAVTLGAVAAQEPGKDDPGRKPQWQRLLQGEDATKAADLQKQIDQAEKAGRREEAVKLAEELLALRARLQGEDHYQVRVARNTLAELRRPPPSAEQRRRLEEADQLNGRVMTLYGQGQFEEATGLAQECLKIRKAALGEKHPDTANSINNLAMLYRAQARYADAEPLFRDALRIYRDILGEMHPATANNINNLATLYQDQGRYAEAEPLFRDALRIRRDALGERHPVTATSLNNLALLYHNQGKYAEAEPLLRDALCTRKGALGESHPDTAASLNNLAELYRLQSRHAEAEPLYRDALRIYRDALGERHPDTANCLNNLALLYRAQARHAEAEPLLRDALRIYKDVLGEMHPATANCINNLATLYEDQGRYAEAEPLFRDALRIRKAALGLKHPVTAASLNNLAALYRDQGRFAEAEPLYRQALGIIRDALGEKHPDTATGINNLAGLYQEQGKYAEAEPLLRDALRIYRDALGEKHPATANSLNNLAALYQEQARYAEAEPLLRDALRIRKDALGLKHPDTATSINSLAMLYQAQGRYARAEPLLRDALRIRKAALGERHPDTATSINNLAMLYEELGQYAEAEPLLRDALRIRKAAAGEKHPATAVSLNNLALLYQAQGKYAEAEPLLAECTRSYEASRLLHARAVERSVGNVGNNPYPPLAAAAAHLGRPADAWRALESDLARGLLDERAARRGDRLTPGEQRQRSEIAGRLAAVEARVLKLVTQPEQSEAERKELDGLAAERRDREDALANLAAAVSRREVAGLAEVQAALGPTSALLAWVDVTSTDGRLQEHWACVVRGSGPPCWERLPGTGEGGKWTEADAALPAQLRAALSEGGSAAQVADLARRLRAQRIAPALKHLGGVRTLYVAPVKQMAGVPVEVLIPDYTVGYVPSGTFLARRGKLPAGPATLLALGDPTFPKSERQKPPTALPPGGLLITQVLPGSSAASARLQAGDVLVAYAGVGLESYEQLTKLIAEKAGEKKVAVEFWRESEDKVATREVAPGRLGVALAKEPARDAITARRQADALVARLSRGGDWAELPGTQVEVGELRKLFDTERVTRLTGSEASERALEALRKKGELSKFRYLHFATHGEANSLRAFDSRLILAQDRPPETLARPGEPLLDNQLTAAEVLEFWRLDAELVTLSACETALGVEGGGDGLLGFAQAFLLAGSRAVCLSLWKVDDTATALLMDRFYRNLLGKRDDGARPMGKAAALREAKEWLRRLTLNEATARLGALTDGVSRGSKKGRNVVGDVPAPKDAPKDARPYAHPRYWAAFILIGDPD